MGKLSYESKVSTYSEYTIKQDFEKDVIEHVMKYLV